MFYRDGIGTWDCLYYLYRSIKGAECGKEMISGSSRVSY